jgi:hypothetical protein
MTTIYEEKVENDEEDDEVGESDEEDDEVGESDEVISSPSNSTIFVRYAIITRNAHLLKHLTSNKHFLHSHRTEVDPNCKYQYESIWFMATFKRVYCTGATIGKRTYNC